MVYNIEKTVKLLMEADANNAAAVGVVMLSVDELIELTRTLMKRLTLLEAQKEETKKEETKIEEPVPVKQETPEPKFSVGDLVIHKNMLGWGVGKVGIVDSKSYSRSNYDHWDEGKIPFSKRCLSPFYLVRFPKQITGWWSNEDLLVGVEIQK
jgi:hypothetical protein